MGYISVGVMERGLFSSGFPQISCSIRKTCWIKESPSNDRHVFNKPAPAIQNHQLPQRQPENSAMGFLLVVSGIIGFFFGKEFLTS